LSRCLLLALRLLATACRPASALSRCPQHLLPRAARLPAAGVSLRQRQRQRLPAPLRPPWAGKGQTQVR
jgi:hypothetical protein